MPVHKIVSHGTRVQLWMDSSAPRSDFDIIQLLIDEGGDTPEARVRIAGHLKQTMQDDIDVRIKRNTLPADDEARQSNPNRPDFFWDKGDLVSRPVIVESVVWDGERYVPTLRRGRP